MLLSFQSMGRKSGFTYLYLAFSLFCCVILLNKFDFPLNSLNLNSPRCRGRKITEEEYSHLLIRQRKFWHRLSDDLDTHAPKCDPLIHPENTHLDIFYNANQPQTRPDNLTTTSEQLTELQVSHHGFSNKIKTQARHMGTYGLLYIKSTRGIVTTAGGPYLPVAVLSVRMLRKTASQLPIEVFLSTKDEWDPQICEVILPSMNARCRVLQEIFETTGQATSEKIDKYQYKVLSILFSSFEEVLFVDSDCFPTSDPEQLFVEDPFTATGLVLWPDFWYPSESPLFFQISGIEEPQLHTRSSTESGEIMYSKPKHEMSLLLATYYNYYGPDFYYPLQSQGAPGEGDKETFYWAAVAYREEVYSVRTSLQALGYNTTEGEWRGSAMLQHDPIKDLLSSRDMQAAGHNASTSDRHTNKISEISKRPFFVHANFPKFDPATIFQQEAMGATGPTRDADGTIRRVWHETIEEAIEDFGFDLERRLWGEIKDMSCEYEGKITAWEGKFDICKNATIYWNAIHG